MKCIHVFSFSLVFLSLVLVLILCDIFLLRVLKFSFLINVFNHLGVICLCCMEQNPFYFLNEFSHHHLLNNPSISLWFVMPLLPHSWFCICVSLFLDFCVLWSCLSKLYDLLITVALEKCWCMVIRHISSFYFPLKWSWLYVALFCHLNFRISL